ICDGQRLRIRILREQRGSNHVDALVGALRAQDRGDEKLIGIAVVERRRCVRILRREAAVDLGRTLRRGRETTCARGNFAADRLFASDRLLAGDWLLRHRCPLRYGFAPHCLRCLAKATTPVASRALSTSLRSSQPLRAIATPSSVQSSALRECASGPISMVTPSSFA